MFVAWLAALVCCAMIWGTTEVQAAPLCPRSEQCPHHHTPPEPASLPPLDEPLVPREVPAAWRTPAQALHLKQLSPVETTWHLSLLRGGQPARRVLTASTDSTATDVKAWRREPLATGRWFVRALDDQAEPRELGEFGVPCGTPISGDFDGDGRSELGVFIDGEWFVDLNRNHVWDEGDLWLQLGQQGDQPVTGDWDGDGKTDIGIFGASWAGDEQALEHERGLPDVANTHGARASDESREARRLLTWRVAQLAADSTPRRDPIDHVLHFGATGDVAIVGDFNGDGIDTIGIYRSGKWALDINGNGQFDAADEHFEFGARDDQPVVADLDGDGTDELGVFRVGRWIFDSDHNRRLDEHDRAFEFGHDGDRPLVGDFSGDGRIQLIVVRGL
ncbi:MAG: VCBS repeat-containing protein [Planctomycetaceae bacterium]|nr:VCBS repeat-containing protein [Planctomycetaceae bacterium]